MSSPHLGSLWNCHGEFRYNRQNFGIQPSDSKCTKFWCGSESEAVSLTKAAWIWSTALTCVVEFRNHRESTQGVVACRDAAKPNFLKWLQVSDILIAQKIGKYPTLRSNMKQQENTNCQQRKNNERESSLKTWSAHTQTAVLWPAGIIFEKFAISPMLVARGSVSLLRGSEYQPNKWIMVGNYTRHLSFPSPTARSSFLERNRPVQLRYSKRTHRVIWIHRAIGKYRDLKKKREIPFVP